MTQEFDAHDTEQTDVEAADEERRDRRKSPWPWIALVILILIILWLIWLYLGGMGAGRRGLSGVSTTTDVSAPSQIPPGPPSAPATPNPVGPTVPDVIGMSKQDAIAVIQGAGYEALVSELYGMTHPANTVFHQNPSGGSMLKEGGTVVIQVQQRRKAVTMYTMPDLRGLKQATAVGRLAAMGISPTLSYAPVRGKMKVGTVNSQWPLAGHSVARGGEAQLEIFVNP